MEEIVMFVIAIVTVLVVSSWGWKVMYWVWLKPLKLQRQLRKQGIRGSSYRFLFGDLKENASMIKEATSKPMDHSHRIVPRVSPFHHLMVEKYGKLSFNWFGPTMRVQVLDPYLVRDVLSNKSGHFSKTSTIALDRLLASGLLSYEGEKWVKHRRIIIPAFHVEKLKMMLPAFHTSCSEMVSKWQKMVPADSGEVDVWPYFQNLTADVISRAAFGSSYEEGRRIFQLQTEQANLVMQATQSPYIPGYSFVPTKRNMRMKQIYTEVIVLLRDIINKRENAIKVGEANNDDLLGLLMVSNVKEIQDNDHSKNVGMSIDEVIEECKLFYFAGQETTSTLLTWTMIVLSMHPEWQTQAREEVLQVFGKQKPDFNGLNRLKIVTMILNEVLRLYPSAAMIIRATNNTTKLGEVSLPPGVHITMPTLLIHHDREVWGDDVDEFNPRRFADGVSKATKNRASFIPFGWGPRICIGQNFAMMEAKLGLAMILQNFLFELSPTYVHAPHTVVTLQPQHGAQLILHKL